METTLTGEQEWQEVEKAWERVYFNHGRVYAALPNGSEAILSGNPRVPMYEAEAIHAAYLYTLDIQRRIAEVREEIAWLLDGPSNDDPAFQRILAREQSALAALQKGLRHE